MLRSNEQQVVTNKAATARYRYNVLYSFYLYHSYQKKNDLANMGDREMIDDVIRLRDSYLRAQLSIQPWYHPRCADGYFGLPEASFIASFKAIWPSHNA